MKAVHVQVKKGVSPHEIRRRFDDELVAKKAVDLIRRVVPLKADRALPGDLTHTMRACGWSCVVQVPQVFRPVVKPPGWNEPRSQEVASASSRSYCLRP